MQLGRAFLLGRPLCRGGTETGSLCVGLCHAVECTEHSLQLQCSLFFFFFVFEADAAASCAAASALPSASADEFFFAVSARARIRIRAMAAVRACAVVHCEGVHFAAAGE